MSDLSKSERILAAALFCQGVANVAEKLVNGPESDFRANVKAFRAACRMASQAVEDAHRAANRLDREAWLAELRRLGRSPSVLPSQKQARCEHQNRRPADRQPPGTWVCRDCGALGQTRVSRSGATVRQVELPLPEPCPCGRTAILPSIDGQPPVCRECADAVLAYRPRERFSHE